MAESLHKRQSVRTTMALLDDVVTIEKCFSQITIAVHGTPVRQRVKKLIAHGENALCNMRKLTAEMSNKRTILAHQHMSIEDERPIPVGKSAP